MPKHNRAVNTYRLTCWKCHTVTRFTNLSNLRRAVNAYHHDHQDQLAPERIEVLVMLERPAPFNLEAVPVDRGRYSVENLLRHMDARSIVEAARTLDVHQSQIHRWKHTGLTDETADELAVRIGSHPAVIWPEWLDAIEVDA